MRLAIVAFNAYPAIVPSAGTAIGGLETFAWTLARSLARQPDLSVQFLVRHSRQPERQTVEGVELFCQVDPLLDIRRAVRQDLKVTGRFPWVQVNRWRPAVLGEVARLAWSKLTQPRPNLDRQLDRLLNSAQPDVVLVLGVSDASAAAVRAAQSLGLPAWIWWRSNADLDERFLSDDQFVDPYGVTAPDARSTYRADGLICQTEWQRDRAEQLLHRESLVIPNPIDGERFRVGDSLPASRPEVLWIGRYDRHHKRPLLAVEVARLCPDVRFRFVINRGDPAVEVEFRQNCPPNVRIADYIPNDAMPEAQRGARLFLSTGSRAFEGFPNVLLEAAACGTPIVSLEDFDGFLKKSNAGYSSGEDIARLAAKIRELWEMPAAWQAYSQVGAEYVRQHHSIDRCTSAIQAAIRSALLRNGPGN